MKHDYMDPLSPFSPGCSVSIQDALLKAFTTQLRSILNDNDAAIRRGAGLRVVLELRSGGKVAGAKCTTFYGCVDTEGR